MNEVFKFEDFKPKEPELVWCCSECMCQTFFIEWDKDIENPLLTCKGCGAAVINLEFGENEGK